MAEFTPHPFQQRALDSKARFILCIAGVQGGKTTGGAAWLLREIYNAYLAGTPGDWLIAAPTVNILRQSTLPKFKQFFPADWGHWREQKKCFELAWGDTIYVRSTDEPDHLEGMTIKGAWGDEAGQFKEAVWINLQARLAIHKGRAIFTSTPYAINWVYRELIKKQRPDTEVIQWSSIDNPAFPAELYEQAKATMSTALFERRYQGKFTSLEGLVYPEFNDDTLVEPFVVPDTWKRFGGLDFGLTNPSSLSCITEDPDNKIFYVFNEFYRAQASLTEIAEAIKSNDLEYVLGDPQSAMAINELQKFHGVKNLRPADNDIPIGVERIGTLLRAGRLKIMRGKAPNTVEEMESYHYAAYDPDKTNSDKPIARKNHAMDSLRYAFSKQIEKSLYTNLSKRQVQRYSRKISPVNEWTGY